MAKTLEDGPRWCMRLTSDTITLQTSCWKLVLMSMQPLPKVWPPWCWQQAAGMKASHTFYSRYRTRLRQQQLTLCCAVLAYSATVRCPIPLLLFLQSMTALPFLLPKQGAELELKDCRGWTALFHCTSTGHQQMVKFLLDNNADANVKWVCSLIPNAVPFSHGQV